MTRLVPIVLLVLVCSCSADVTMDEVEVASDEQTVPPIPASELNDLKDALEQLDQWPTPIKPMTEYFEDIKYPTIAQKAGIEGRVVVQFIVDENGSVHEPVVVRGIGAGCDEEAVRVIKTMRFNPALADDVPVKAKMTMPIVFKIPELDA